MSKILIQVNENAKGVNEFVLDTKENKIKPLTVWAAGEFLNDDVIDYGEASLIFSEKDNWELDALIGEWFDIYNFASLMQMKFMKNSKFFNLVDFEMYMAKSTRTEVNE